MSASVSARAVEERGAARWLLVAAAALGFSVSAINTYALGLFVAPLQAEFGWSRTQISFGLTASTIVTTLASPFVGLLVDRWGARWLGIGGVIFYCGVTAMLGAVGAAIWTWWLLWMVMAIGTALVKPVVWTTAVSPRFPDRRGLAFAFVLSGTALSAMTAPIIAEALIGRFGWRTAYPMLGMIWAAVVLPVLLIWFHHRPHRAPDRADAVATEADGIDLRAGYRSRWFAQLLGATFFATLAIMSLIVHFVPLLLDEGYSSASAARLAGMFGVASIIGRIGMGLLLDAMRATLAGAVMLLLPAIACALLLSGVTPVTALAAAMLLGLALGGELDVSAYLSARYFGQRHFGALFGAITSMLSLGTGIGPLLAGYVFDRTGSYDLWLWLMIPASMVAALFIASLGNAPDYQRPQTS